VHENNGYNAPQLNSNNNEKVWTKSQYPNRLKSRLVSATALPQSANDRQNIFIDAMCCLFNTCCSRWTDWITNCEP